MKIGDIHCIGFLKRTIDEKELLERHYSLKSKHLLQFTHIVGIIQVDYRLLELQQYMLDRNRQKLMV